MKIENLKFDLIKDYEATATHSASVIVDVTCESKKILGMGVVTFGPAKGKLIIFYEEK